MATRIIVAMYAWIAESTNQMPTSNWWINVTDGGLPVCDQYVIDRNASTPSNVKAAVSQYHVYFADGGHARYKLRYDIVNAWTQYSPIQANLAPVPLLPKPEWEVQEGI